MESMAYLQAGNLSYGVQRRLEILRALATNPKILFLDEPAAGMNPSEKYRLLQDILKIKEIFKIAMIIVEHDMKFIMNICDKIYVLNDGKIIAEGKPCKIQKDKNVIEVYLGKGNRNA